MWKIERFSPKKTGIEICSHTATRIAWLIIYPPLSRTFVAYLNRTDFIAATVTGAELLLKALDRPRGFLKLNNCLLHLHHRGLSRITTASIRDKPRVTVHQCITVSILEPV